LDVRRARGVPPALKGNTNRSVLRTFGELAPPRLLDLAAYACVSTIEDDGGDRVSAVACWAGSEHSSKQSVLDAEREWQRLRLAAYVLGEVE
jgi:hypothetical protein